MTTTVALVLASVALVVACTATGLAVVVMRQNAATAGEIRHHRGRHQRTHGVPDPDPEHHGNSPTVQRLSADLEALGGLYEQLADWARGAEQRLPAPNGHPTTLMPAADRPRPQERRP